MLLSLTLDDKDGNPVTLSDAAGNVGLVEVQGLIGIGPPRDSRRVRPQSHGAIDETRFEDGRLIALVLEAAGPTYEAAIVNFRAVTAALLDTWESGPALLKWTEGTTGAQLQRLVRLASDVSPPIQDNAARFLFSVQLFAEDPCAYAQAATTTSGLLSGGGGGLVAPIVFPVVFSQSFAGTLSINNMGNRKAPLVLRVYGQCVNPSVLIVETGETITLSGTINLGDYVEIDTQTRTLLLNGVTSVGSLLDSASTRWFSAPRGISTLRLLANSYDTNASLTATYRSAYA